MKQLNNNLNKNHLFLLRKILVKLKINKNKTPSSKIKIYLGLNRKAKELRNIKA